MNENKNYAFITGATGVTGKHFALAYAKRGYNLFLTGRGEERLAAVRDEILKQPGIAGINIVCFSCDLSDASDRDKMYAFMSDSGINITRAVNVAGVDNEGPFMGFSKDLIRKMMRVNAETPIEIAGELIRRYDRERDGGLKIITVSSLAAYFRMPLMALYSASKRTLYHFFLALKKELKGTGISSTLILPGAVPTRPDIIDRIKAQGFFGKISSVPPEKVAEKSIRKSEKNRAVYVPGVFNKFLRTLSFIVPAGLVSKVAGAQWRRAMKRNEL